MCQLEKEQKMVKIYFLKLLPTDLVNIKKLLMVQQSCSSPTFYQTDFYKSRLYVPFIKKIPLEMVISQQMKKKWHDQNF